MIEIIKIALKRRVAVAVLIGTLFGPWHIATAQVTTVPLPAPVQSVPLAPPPGAPALPDVPPAAPAPVNPPLPAPPVQAIPAVPPASPQPPVIVAPPEITPQTGPDSNATLAGKPGDPMNVDEVVLPQKPALVISGQTTWDKGFDILTETFRRLDAEATRLGLKVAGRPLTYFVETDDMGFRYDAILPVDRTPDVGTPGGSIRSGQTPQGNALRFTHKGPYEDVDTTYEGITAYLDAKGVTVRDQFIEEYVNEPKDAADPNFEINIYVQPK
ncbi:MAG: GyrI-like domain-containing protein [Bosea sp. (in: a-proteobacteria)]